ncbi:gliding motility protein GldL [Polaribacter sargassicola]|uniref:type IX secretion system motor protein PorL/GldL n=1 Tax=Polaribacter sargassicola TaxID=2836891 RepID=UPI001F210D59|nr:gliding motility protein GldL [Polaribacter sp. DS7-9]MCG1036241.1 gliding motility protein GldL [Polaribacter sp. DS7-9]
MAQSRSYKKIMNFVYGMGAAVVIIGALFKIQHIEFLGISGGMMLTVGLLVEAFVFAVSAFDTPEEDFDWTKVYPELEGGESLASSKPEEKLGAQGLLSQKIDDLLNDAKIDADLMKKLGSSMKNFQNAAEGLSSTSTSVASTNKYNEQVTLAAAQLESLNNLYKIQVENTGKHTALNTAVVENTEKLQKQMAALEKNLSSLNSVYGGMLSAMSK